MKTWGLSLAIAVGALIFVQGCGKSADLTQLQEKHQGLQTELDTAKAESEKLQAKVQSLEKDLANTRKVLVAAETDSARLQTEKQELETKLAQQDERLTRLYVLRPGVSLTPEELQEATLGKTKAQIQALLGPPTTTYGSGGSYWKYSGICRAQRPGAADGTVQLNFDGDVLRSIYF